MKPVFITKILLYISLFIFTVVNSSSQNKTIMPPTPTVSALAKFIDQPVSYCTGVPEIKIPLWTINLKNFSTSIDLNYHSGGVKVEEEASFVGLGWSLIAGGVITRSVRDIPDDYNKGEVISSDKDVLYGGYPEDEHPRVGRFWTGKYETLRDFDFFSSNGSYILSTLQSIKSNYNASPGCLHGNNDIEPDIFYFSFGKKSGKFVFDVDGLTQRATLIPYQDVVVNHKLSSTGEIASFTIKDNDGTEYLFDKVERLIRTTGSQSNEMWRYPIGSEPPSPQSEYFSKHVFKTEYNSSWYLSQIKTVLGEVITISYADESMWQYDRPGAGSITGIYISGAPYNVFNVEDGASNESTTKKRITKIETDKEVVNFISSHSREDVYLTGYALSEIQIINKATNTKIKSFNLGYSYFQSPTSETFAGITPFIFPIPTAHVPSYYKRLRLDSITPVGQNNEKVPPFVFSYDLTTLPHRFSYQQDLWGYFNGASGNTNLFPTLYVYPLYSGSDRFRVYPTCNTYPGTDNYTLPGGNRLPNSNVMKAGTLTRITYPTGGCTEFTFEPHTFVYDNCTYTGGGLRIKSIKNYTASNNLATERLYSYVDTSGISSGRITSMPVFADKTFIQIKYYNSSRAALGQVNGSIVGYQAVTEKTIDGNNFNGCNTYNYMIPAKYGETADSEFNLYNISQVKWLDNVTPTTYGASGYVEYLNYKNNYHLLPNTQPFPPNPDYDWARGLLVKVSTFNKDGVLIQEKTNTYKAYKAPNSKGAKSIYGLAYRHIGYDNTTFVYTLVYSKYSYITNTNIVLDKTTAKEYSGVNPITIEEKFEYLEKSHMNPVKRTTYKSDGTTVISKYKYPYDYTAKMTLYPAILNMQIKNLTSIPIERLTYLQRNNQLLLISGDLTKYIMQGSLVLPENEYKVETATPITDFMESYSEIDELYMD